MSKDSIEQLIQAEAKKIAEKMMKDKNVEVPEGESLYKIGAKLFVRTVTYHYTGRISFLSEKEMVLSDAAWVASSGRWSESLTTGNLSEVEPYPDCVSLNRDTIVDVSIWKHPLPRDVK